MRPSRQPLRGFLRMRALLNAISNLPHAEERPLRDAACGGSSGQAGASQSTHSPAAALLSPRQSTVADRRPVRIWAARCPPFLQLPQPNFEVARFECPQKAFDHLRHREPLAGGDGAPPDRVGDHLDRAQDVARAVNRRKGEFDRPFAARRDGAVETKPQRRSFLSGS